MAWVNSVNATQTGVQTINSGIWTGSALTQYNVLIAGASSAIVSVAPSSTTGIALVSQGASSNPAFSTVVVAGGGTGLTALTAHYLLVGNGTSNVTLVAPSATSGIPLISQGASSDPTYGTAVVAGGGTGATSFTAYSVITGGTTSTGALQNVSGVGTTGQVLTSNGASALPSWQNASSSVFPWTDVTTTSQSMAINNGYTANNAGLVTLTLPSTAAYGSIVRVSGKGAGGWTIAQNSGQTIHFGSVNTTTGTGGSLSSTLQYDTVESLCSTANTDWTVQFSIGNITYV